MKNIEEMTDEQLAMSYINGNNQAFDLLLARNQSKLFQYIMFVVRDHEIADDVFQDTFVKIIMRLQQGKYSPNGKFCAWCMRIAHNIIMDMYRDNRGKHIIEAAQDNDLSQIGGDDTVLGNVEMDFINSQVMDDVRKMMNLLPPVQREVVYMRYYQDLSFKEIAELTNVSINTSLGRMRYAILNMRRMARENNISLEML